MTKLPIIKDSEAEALPKEGGSLDTRLPFWVGSQGSVLAWWRIQTVLQKQNCTEE